MVEAIGQKALSVGAPSQAAPVRPSTQNPRQSSAEGRPEPRARDVVQLGSGMPDQRKALGIRTLHQVRDGMAKIELLAALTPKAAAHGLKMLALTLASAAETYASAGNSIDVPLEIRQLDAQMAATQGVPQDGPSPQPAPAAGAEKQADEQFAAEVDGLQRQLDAQFQGLAVAAREEDAGAAVVIIKQYGEASLATSGALATIAGWHDKSSGPATPTVDVSV